ncbi:ATP-binding cassette domain-containing protein [Engelhardtia mirabilis]|uniref:Lipopolysaccharide export system ATP-binding protein LptB n=1 Tax=Engelhardtia mirabilis TaxID=2528011 RepID=A0A518BKJ7_9BACT|nr:Lipopolysaccharide export system ATP-binding protein LptB [Planctomycetes bacterium Pla133]QDV01821.1 Lipopolysaccharide export system ATP-binding protein LptB [Planctomycetes bacterium Pla86]
MALRIEGLRVSYGSRRAVEDLSLVVPDGSITGFLGHNGAGKTSAMRGVLGLVPIRAGRVSVDGIDAGRHPARARARIGALIETTSFQPGWSAHRNLTELARLGGASLPDARRDASHRLEQVGLTHVSAERPSSFSQGMRQRLGLAQALLGGRRTLLLDEPTNGLDPEGIAELSALLVQLRDEEGAAILLSSHLLSEVEDLCDRIAVLREGRLVASGTTEQLLVGAGAPHRVRVKEPLRATTRLTELGISSQVDGARVDFELGGAEPAEVLESLVAAGAGVERFGPQPRSLVGLYRRATEGEFTAESLPPAPSPDPHARSAPSGVWRLLRFELSRLAGSAWILALPAVLAGISVARLAARAREAAAQVEAEGLFSATEPTAFAATAAGLAVALPAAALIASLGASLLVAGELGRGTLRNVALRPLTRLQLLAGKASVAIGLGLAAWFCAAMTSLVAAAIWFDFGDLEEVLVTGDRFPLMTAAELWPELNAALLGTLVAMPAVAAVGFLVGVLTRRGVVAVVLALIIHQLLDGARAIARTGDWEWMLPSTYLPSPLGDSSRVQALALLSDGATNAPFEYVAGEWWVPLAWTVACLVLATPVLLRRSIP